MIYGPYTTLTCHSYFIAVFKVTCEPLQLSNIIRLFKLALKLHSLMQILPHSHNQLQTKTYKTADKSLNLRILFCFEVKPSRQTESSVTIIRLKAQLIFLVYDKLLGQGNPTSY